jgi:hypothetical protein
VKNSFKTKLCPLLVHYLKRGVTVTVTVTIQNTELRGKIKRTMHEILLGHTALHFSLFLPLPPPPPPLAGPTPLSPSGTPPPPHTHPPPPFLQALVGRPSGSHLPPSPHPFNILLGTHIRVIYTHIVSTYITYLGTHHKEAKP